MFTGLIQHVGRVASVQAVGDGAEIRIDPAGWSHVPDLGSSIAVDGCCLTVVAVDEHGWRFDAVRQTLDLTTLGGLAAGDPVNLEHAVSASTLMGGHVVQGHVDATGTVRDVSDADRSWRVRIAVEPDLMARVVDQGSITVAGVSLTVAGTGDDWFDVALIPATLDATTLGRRVPGDRVNLETDVLARMVARWMERMMPGGQGSR
ncbi:MAG: riboflavin synthase [Phycisphaerales bacterium]